MERLLIIIGALVVGALLLYSSLMQHQAPALDPAELAAVSPSDEWFQAEVLQAPETVLVEFGAKWCGPCRQLGRLFPRLEEEFGEALKIVEVDIDERPELAASYDIGPIPTLLVVKDGTVVAAQEGFSDYRQLAGFIRPHVSEPTEVATPAAPAADVLAAPSGS